MTMRQTINAQAFNIRPEFTGPRDEQAEKDLETLFRDGVVVLPGLISADQCDLLKATVKAIGGEEAKQTGRAEFGRARFEGTRTKRVYGLASKSPVFDELLLHPRILSILDRSLYPGYLLHTCQSTEVPFCVSFVSSFLIGFSADFSRRSTPTLAL